MVPLSLLKHLFHMAYGIHIYKWVLIKFNINIMHQLNSFFLLTYLTLWHLNIVLYFNISAHFILTYFCW